MTDNAKGYAIGIEKYYEIYYGIGYNIDYTIDYDINYIIDCGIDYDTCHRLLKRLSYTMK